VLALVLEPRPRTQAHAQVHANQPHARRARPFALGGRHGAALQMSLAVLVRERRGELLAKGLTATAVVAAAVVLVTVFERDARSFPTVLLAEGCVALTFSGLFRGLHLAHRASVGYVGALPLPAGWWRPYDLTAVLAAALPFLGALTAFAWVTGAAPFTGALAALASNAALLCALRTPQLINDRHAVVLATLMAGCWTAATIACLLQETPCCASIT
jgi:hypothetical protein